MKAWIRETDRIRGKLNYHRTACYNARMAGDIPRMLYHAEKLRRLANAWERALSL